MKATAKPRVRLPAGSRFSEINHLLRSRQLITVCEEAKCPNRHECWNLGTATFMILGDTCSRSCGFCNVKTGRPGVVDEEEPRRVAAAVAEMGIRHAVITSVNRDELPDGGAHVFAACIEEIRRSTPEVTVEVLIPDYLDAALDLVLAARPAVLNHNVETVPRLYRRVRPQARYQRSLEVLRQASTRGAYTKSGLMVGLGEEEDEVMRVLEDLRSVGCRFVTIGQYLQPSKRHLPVDRYVDAEEFRRYARQARRLGFQRVQSGPLVRSSYHAADFV